MPRFSFSSSLPHTVGAILSAALWAVVCCAFTAVSANAQVTLLVPSQPSIEAPAKTDKADPSAKRDDKKQESKQPAPKPEKSADTGKTAASARKPEAANAPTAKAAPGAEQGAAKAPAPQGTPPQATPPQGTPPVAEAPAPPPPPELPAIDEQVDVLITMMRPFQYQSIVMDMPQLFAVLRYDNASPVKDGLIQPERRDLLGDVEEIGYLDQKAWGANVALTIPGLYQFIIEGRPWWDAARGQFLQHYVKTMLPVHGVERGWEQPVGQVFEIQALTRPFGLTAPALFTGVALLHGKALPNAPVRMVRINTEKRPVPTPWHEEMEARTDKAGQFSFILNQPGWWCCMAIAPGDPLKGPDGQPKPLNLGALFWLYVDGAADARKR
ncbi:MAG: cobalt ABC transporter substrate-binding protein [Desulfovibrio sp. MES5]|nr:MAG: cobalt ABC transporter substrate-binding protein [Desulfovibrio sp. MES5]